MLLSYRKNSQGFWRLIPPAQVKGTKTTMENKQSDECGCGIVFGTDSSGSLLCRWTQNPFPHIQIFQISRFSTSDNYRNMPDCHQIKQFARNASIDGTWKNNICALSHDLWGMLSRRRINEYFMKPDDLFRYQEFCTWRTSGEFWPGSGWCFTDDCLQRHKQTIIWSL